MAKRPDFMTDKWKKDVVESVICQNDTEQDFLRIIKRSFSQNLTIF